MAGVTAQERVVSHDGGVGTFSGRAMVLPPCENARYGEVRLVHHYDHQKRAARAGVFPFVRLPFGPVRRRVAAVDLEPLGLCIDEGVLSCVTGMCCSYMDFHIK